MPVQKDPRVPYPEAPFTSINLFEIAEEDVDQFVSDWKRRAQVMGQQPGYIHANLHRSLLPDHRYRLVNISLWHSYNAFIAATNNEGYAEQLTEDLGRAPEMTVTRGYYRPVASYTQLYDK